MDERLKEKSGLETGGLVSGSVLRLSGNSLPACHPFFTGFWSRRMSRRGQQAVEYALLIATVSAALLTMYMYGKRGLQANIKGLVDNEIGSQVAGYQLLSAGSHSNSTSSLSTLSRDEISVHKEPFEAQYNFSSTTTTEGWSRGVYNEL
ncbi:MAG: hypothetical protein WC732_05840 [Candidatus Omnitrophota bacterium]